MAIKKTYTVLDTKSQTFLNPISFINDGDAIRWFTTAVNDTENVTNVSKYPEQFILYRTSDFDDQLGMYTNQIDGKDILHVKELIIGTQCLKEKNKEFTLQELFKLFEDYQNSNVKKIGVK